MSNRPTSRQLQGHFNALRARRSNTTAEVIDIASGNYGSGKTYAGASEVSSPAWAAATATFYVYLDQNEELVLNGTSGFPELSTWIARVVVANGVIMDVLDERASINSWVDGYQVGFDDSESCAAFGDSVQEALAALDAYVCNDLNIVGAEAVNTTKHLNLDIVGGIPNGLVSNGHVSQSPVIFFTKQESGVGRMRYSASVPPDIVDGTDIVVKLFWSAPDAIVGDVRWRLRYRALTSSADDVDSTMTTDVYVQATSGVANRLSDTGENLVISFSDISANDILVVNVERTSANANDTYEETARLHLVRLEYTGRGVD